jgi:hypothetical protein
VRGERRCDAMVVRARLRLRRGGSDYERAERDGLFWGGGVGVIL